MCETFKHFVRKGKVRGELERRLRLYTKPTTCGKISFEGDSNAEAYLCFVCGAQQATAMGALVLIFGKNLWFKGGREIKI